MRILYFDCTGGVSGDMILSGLLKLTGPLAEVDELNELADLTPHVHERDACGHDHGHDYDRNHEHKHDHGEHHRHGRSGLEVRCLIETSPASEQAREVAEEIYNVIGAAECKVHQVTAEDLHFHEVGRDEAILNALKIGTCLAHLDIDEICCSKIVDGCGFIECSHGRLPVPVPAVRAMMDESDLVFEVNRSVETEMVTPSGLGTLMGIGAVYQKQIPDGRVLKTGTGLGKRQTGLGGLEVSLIEY